MVIVKFKFKMYEEDDKEFKFGEDVGANNQFFDHRAGMSLNRDAEREELER
jgi:hypothetical protein